MSERTLETSAGEVLRVERLAARIGEAVLSDDVVVKLEAVR